MFPPIPEWDGLHPLVVHFPVALLLVAPLFIFLAMILSKRGQWFAVSALILLVLGTVGALVAISTGEAARDLVEDGPDAMFDLIDKHEELAEMTRTVYVALTGAYAVAVIVLLLIKGISKPAVLVTVQAVFLLLSLGACLLLANTAHAGGRLVHQYGVHAVLVPGAGAAEESGDSSAEENEESPPSKDS
jgi:uncharacterized membrane protein